MPARRTNAGGLTSEQLTRLAEDVAAGRRPRVRLSGGQFPDDATGTVLRVGDPGTDGDDFVLVRVKVHGVTDELRFAPAELAVGRRPAAVPAAAAKPARRARPPRAAPTTPSPVAAPTPPARPAAPATSPTRAPGQRKQKAPPPPVPPTPRPAARRPASVPTVTITITSSGASWSVAAKRGAKTVVKKADVTPGSVAAIAALLGDAGVEEAVAAVNDSARAEAEARAEKLRAELAEVEAVLVSHRRP